MKELQKLSDEQLMSLVEDFKKPSIPEDSLVREIVKEHFGEINILVLQMNQLLWPLIEVISERFKSYSPHIQKN